MKIGPHKKRKVFNLVLGATAGLLLVVGFYWNNIFHSAVNITPAVGTNDMTDYYYPIRYFLGQSLAQGEFALWTPHISTGYPLLASGVGALYPLNLWFANLATLTSVNLTIVSSYFFIFLFSFLYLRQIHVGTFASIFGALIIAFSGFAANELLHIEMLTSFYLFIAQLWLLDLYTEHGGGFILPAVMGLLLGLSFLGGHAQIILYGLIFLFLYGLVFWMRRKGNIFIYLLSFVIFLVLGLGTGAGQILPQAELMLNSTRATGVSAEAIDQFNFPVSQLQTFIQPFSKVNPEHTFQAFIQNGWPEDERYIYMGLLGLGFAFAGILRIGKMGPRALFFLVASLCAMILSFGSQFTLGFILKVPPLSYFRIPFRFIFLVNFSLGVLAAMTLDRFRGWIEEHTKPILAGFLLVVVILLSFFDLKINAKKLHPEFSAELWYQIPQIVSFLEHKLQGQERVTAQQYVYPTAKIFLEQPQIWDNPAIFINLRNLLPVYTNLLYGIGENIGAANSATLKIERFNTLETELYFRGMRYDETGVLSLSDSLMFLDRLMGVRYFFTTQPVEHFNLVKVKEIAFTTGQDPVYVYELFDYYPRVFMVPRAQKAEPEEIKEHLFKADFDPKLHVYIEEDSDWGAKGGYAADAKFETYSDQEVVINTEASGDGFLFLSDAYYPGWKAYVDGQETRILRADYAFRTIPVPEGNHTVVFRYEPQSFWWGIRITLATTALTMMGILFVMIMGRKDTKRSNG